MDSNNEIITLIIAYSGDAISSFMEAIELARQGQFDESDKKCDDANEKLLKAHEAHTQLLVKEARQEKIDYSLLLIHASTHLANAEMTSNMATCLIKQYKER